MRRLLRIFVLFFVLSSAIMMLQTDATHAQEDRTLGADMIAPGDPSWNTIQRPLFRQMRANAARFRIPAGFGGQPRHVEDLIADGARLIVLTTEDCEFTPERTKADLIGRGFLDVIQRHRNVEWWLELGNEQNLCGMDAWTARFWLHRTATELSWLRQYGIRIAASMPTSLADVQVILGDGAVLGAVDGIATHIYAWHNPATDAGGGDWHQITSYVASKTEKPILITEIGIDDRATPKPEKARRILNWIDTQPRFHTVIFFAISDPKDTRWPQYFIDEPMAAVLANRAGAPAPAPAPQASKCRYFPETGHSLCNGFKAYWETYGGLAIFGFPISGEFKENGVTVQYFERARFEWHPGAWPERYDVLLGRLGADIYQQRYGKR